MFKPEMGKNRSASAKPKRWSFFCKSIAVIGLVVAVVAVVVFCAGPSSVEVGEVREKPKLRNTRPSKKDVRPVARQTTKNSVPAKNMPDTDKGKKQEIPKVSDAGSVQSSETFVMSMEEEAKQMLPKPDLDSASVKDMLAVFSQAAVDDLSDDQFMQLLSDCKKSDVLGTAGHVMKFGESTEKRNALRAVGLFFGKESSTGIPFEKTHQKDVAIGNNGEVLADTASEADNGDSVAADGQPSDIGGFAAKQTQGLVATVFAGLSDDDEVVRETAFDVMRSLPDEESGILAARLLSEGNTGLQERLVREAGRGEFDVRLLLMGMGSENEVVRSLAAENLKNASGQEFASQHEAAEWYEAHHAEFQQGAENTPTGMGKTNQKEKPNENTK